MAQVQAMIRHKFSIRLAIQREPVALQGPRVVWLIRFAFVPLRELENIIQKFHEMK
jgi:hypothetical protein